MKNAYYQQTIEILTAKPEGVKLCNIARIIYNSNCGLFEDPRLYDTIYTQLKRFLWTQSRRERSPFQAVNGRWGFYAIKRTFVQQLELPFDDFQYEKVLHQPRMIQNTNTQQLTLFDQPC